MIPLKILFPVLIGKDYHYDSSCHTMATRNGLLVVSLVGTTRPLPLALVCLLPFLKTR